MWILDQLYEGFLKFMDRKSIFENNTTEKITPKGYMDIYGGPEVALPGRYASMMNHIFTSFMYGLVMPIMFPIVVFSLINNYMIERYRFAYQYRTPPQLDNGLNAWALKILSKAPLFMMCFGCWQLGNHEIFFNRSLEMTNFNQGMKPTHLFFDKN